MKQKDLPVVHCSYTNSEKGPAEILDESFRLYLSRILDVFENPIIQYSR